MFNFNVFNVFIGIVSLSIGGFLGYIIRQKIAQKSSESIESKLKTRIEKVREEAKVLFWKPGKKQLKF